MIYVCLCLCMCECVCVCVCVCVCLCVRFSECDLITAVSGQYTKALGHDDRRIGEQSFNQTLSCRSLIKISIPATKHEVMIA